MSILNPEEWCAGERGARPPTTAEAGAGTGEGGGAVRSARDGARARGGWWRSCPRRQPELQTRTRASARAPARGRALHARDPGLIPRPNIRVRPNTAVISLVPKLSTPCSSTGTQVLKYRKSYSTQVLQSKQMSKRPAPAPAPRPGRISRAFWW